MLFSGNEPSSVIFFAKANTSPLTFIVHMLSTSSQQGVLCENITIKTDNTDAYREGTYTFVAKLSSAKYITTTQSASCTYWEQRWPSG